MCENNKNFNSENLKKNNHKPINFIEYRSDYILYNKNYFILNNNVDKKDLKTINPFEDNEIENLNSEKSLERINNHARNLIKKFRSEKDMTNLSDLNRKIIELRNNISMRIIRKCNREITELSKILDFSILSDDDFKKIPKKSDFPQYNVIYDSLTQCANYEMNLRRRIDEKIKFFAVIFDNQYSLCRKNCIENRMYSLTVNRMECIDSCINYSYRIVDPTIDMIIEEIVDEYNHILDHMALKKYL